MQIATQHLIKVRQNQGESTKDYFERIKNALYQLEDATQREIEATLRDHVKEMNKKISEKIF